MPKHETYLNVLVIVNYDIDSDGLTINEYKIDETELTDENIADLIADDVFDKNDKHIQDIKGELSLNANEYIKAMRKRII